MPCKPSSNNTRRRISFRRTSALLPILSIGKWCGAAGIHYDEACSSHAKCYLLLLGVSLTAPILFSELTREFGHAAKSAAQSNKLAKQERCKDKHKSPLCAAMGKKEKKMRMVKKWRVEEERVRLSARMTPQLRKYSLGTHAGIHRPCDEYLQTIQTLYLQELPKLARWISNTPRHRPGGLICNPHLRFLRVRI